MDEEAVGQVIDWIFETILDLWERHGVRTSEEIHRQRARVEATTIFESLQKRNHDDMTVVLRSLGLEEAVIMKNKIWIQP